MQETHSFNEKLKRFEPIDSKCMFCEVGDSQNMNDNCFIPLLKEHESRMTVGVSRCPSCCAIHKSAKLKARLLAWSTGMVICMTLIFIAFWILDNINLGEAMSFAIGMCLGIIIAIAIRTTTLASRALEKTFVKRKGILTKQEGVNKYKVIRELISEGWIYDKSIFVV